MNKLEKYTEITKKICDTGIHPGKKMVQKLMYLIERKDVELDLDYSIHFFGPYSSRLDEALHILQMKGILDIDTSGMTHIIHVNDPDDIPNTLEKKECAMVDFVLDKFASKTAAELEAITTLDYVATQLLKNKGTQEEIIQGVIKIKGKKFSEDYLTREIRILKEFEYIS